MKPKLSHYFSSVTLLSGFLLALTGIAYALSVNLTRKSDPEEIAITYSFIGLGLSLILTGINLMIKNPKEYHYYVVGAGLVLNLIGLGAVLLVYPNGGWVYPNVTYIVVTYTAGICLLAGNAFANSVLTQIEERANQLFEKESEATIKENEDEIEKEVQKTLDKAFSGDDYFSKFNLRVKEKDSDLVLGKAFSESEEKKTIIQDDVSEVESLKLARSGKMEVRDDSLDSASLLLAKAISTEPESKKTRINTKMKLFKRQKNG
jgi:hypothetical protein